MAFLTELTAADSHQCAGHSAVTKTRLHLVQSDQVHPKITLKQEISSLLRVMRSSLSSGTNQTSPNTLDGTAARARALASVRFLGLSSMRQLLKIVEHLEFVLS
jgi:hypothetical protein